MAIERLDYPNAAEPTASLTFPQGGQQFDDAGSYRLNQEIRRAKDQSPIVQRNGSGRRQQRVTFRLMRISPAGEEHETDIEDLIEFIDTIVGGATNPVDWTDSFGVLRTVRIMNETLSWEYESGSVNDIVVACPLTFEVES